MIPEISAIASLAGTIVSVFNRLEQSQQSRLDRETKYELQQAQHIHERTLQDLRNQRPKATTPSQEISSLLTRLWIEGNDLSEQGYEVVFEPVGRGYGVALPVAPQIVLCVWMSSGYPHVAPRVLLKTQRSIDEITSAQSTWDSEILISDIVDAFVTKD